MLTFGDTQRLREILEKNPDFAVQPAEDLRDMHKLLGRPESPPVFCDVGNDWRALLRKLAENGAVRSKVVICTRRPTTDLWAEVFNLGGYDVISLPFEKEPVMRLVKLLGLPLTKAAG